MMNTKTKRVKYQKIIGALAALALSASLLLIYNEGDEYGSFPGGGRWLGESSNEADTIVIQEWPTTADETTIIPTGNYACQNGNAAAAHSSLSTTDEQNDSNDTALGTDDAPAYGRVLLYITSHMSSEHEMFLKYCWPNMLARSKLLQEADVAVYLNPNDETKRKEAMNVLMDTFTSNPNLTVYLRTPQKIQTGANDAMYEAVKSGFFSKYDWVIRLNPDVIVRKDAFLVANMVDASISALLINCSRNVAKVHTDFLAVRPEALLNYPRKTRSAEEALTRSIQQSVLEKEGSYRWITDSSPRPPACRASRGKDYFKSSIVHQHALHPDMCEVPEGVDLMGMPNGSDHPGWPKEWNRV